MKDWSSLPPDDELERADDLLGQADALLRRHRTRSEPASSATDAWAPSAGSDDDDLPILTEVVDDFEFPPDPPLARQRPADAFGLYTPGASAPYRGQDAFTQPAPAAFAAPGQRAADPNEALSSRLAERLVELDTEIAREIGNWVAAEMPQILARELDQLAGRVQAELQAHLRATLLPELSARVGKLLDHAADQGASPDRPPGA
ncbi:MAG: hypothetical protein ACYC5W_10085 [Thauera sp.]